MFDGECRSICCCVCRSIRCFWSTGNVTLNLHQFPLYSFNLGCQSTDAKIHWEIDVITSPILYILYIFKTSSYVGVVDCHRPMLTCGCRSMFEAQGLQPPEHLSSDLLHYADDPPGHAGLHCCLEQVSKAQPSLAAQYRSMSGIEYRSMSDEVCWSTEGECCLSTGVSEYRSTELASGSTAVEQNRATHKWCCRSMEERASLRIERSKLTGSGENSS
ncbi:hypothetical protein F2Q69_00006550 [Brassica cretica]|uniref:Uncharacterized protein n=1 Tax=Brassica cretica TaxID=69181 RepID=A0A8S9PEE5_BRACR|nr:hypothetical protein F2Q69_00006550 [Brassica cretica]